MPRRETPVIKGQYYHVFNRGNQRENIFFEKDNYHFFLKKFRPYIEKHAEILCYCLMPNHYHFLLSPIDDRFSKQMQNFTISYVKAINKRCNRVGHLFQGNFKAKLVDDNNVLLHLTRYIHLNPVEGNFARKFEDWEYSSYREYIGERDGSLPKPDLVLGQFQSDEDYRIFVESYQESDFEIIKEYVFEDE